MSLDDSGAPDPTHYAYRPSAAGAPSEFTLGESDIEWRRGNRAVRVAYADVRKVRLLFRPATVQNYRFVTEIRSRSGIKLSIASTSARGMLEHERLDRAYAAFVAELHRRIATSGAKVTYQAGAPVFLYWPGLLIFVGLMLATATLTVRAVQAGEWKGAALVTVMFGYFLWQSGGFFHRNRPGAYAPDKLPARVLP
jgi:hypothetical protein